MHFFLRSGKYKRGPQTTLGANTAAQTINRKERTQQEYTTITSSIDREPL